MSGGGAGQTPATRPTPTVQPPDPPAADAPVVAMGTVAGPLLAAISFTLVVVVLQSSNQSIKWIDQSLLLLVGGGVAFIFHVQAAAWADRYKRSPNESVKWKNLATRLYNLGVVCLLLGVGLLLVPPKGASNWRLAASYLAFLGVLIELGWVGLAASRNRRARIRLTRPAKRP
jgi:hypothetical protein